MRQLFICTLVIFLLGGFAPVDVEAAKVKHLRTLYADSKDVSLKVPEGVACDEKTVVVSDTGNKRLVIFVWEGQLLVAKSVLPLAGIAPSNIQMNSRGELYLLDTKSRSIIKIGADGTVAGKLEPKNLPGSGKFIPRSFRFDEKDNIYLLDIFSARVLKLDAAGQYQKQLPFPADSGFISDIEISPQGVIYLLDSVAGTIYTTNPGTDAFTPLSEGLKEYMNFPINMAIDNQGIFYLSDQYGSGLALVDRDGSFLGHKFNMGWEDGQFYYPAQICIDGQNRLYVADRNNSRVQAFSILEE